MVLAGRGCCNELRQPPAPPDTRYPRAVKDMGQRTQAGPGRTGGLRRSGGRQPAWEDVRARLHERGLRWTPQRRLLVEVLAGTRGHVTGSELVERCRARDEATTPSTVYRTLDVLEEIGYVRHAHGLDGREEFHVLPGPEHGHLHCSRCGQAWEIPVDEAAGLVRDLERTRGFRVDLGHLTVVGLCRGCRSEG
jgi:Fur family transcriptional regulator, ferric uptake regulator